MHDLRLGYGFPLKVIDQARSHEIFLSMAHLLLRYAAEASQWYQQALTDTKEDGSTEVLPLLRPEAAAVLRVVERSRTKQP
jgi:hypothetical protein